MRRKIAFLIEKAENSKGRWLLVFPKAFTKYQNSKETTQPMSRYTLGALRRDCHFIYLNRGLDHYRTITLLEHEDGRV